MVEGRETRSPAEELSPHTLPCRGCHEAASCVRVGGAGGGKLRRQGSSRKLCRRSAAAPSPPADALHLLCGPAFSLREDGLSGGSLTSDPLLLLIPTSSASSLSLSPVPAHSRRHALCTFHCYLPTTDSPTPLHLRRQHRRGVQRSPRHSSHPPHTASDPPCRPTRTARARRWSAR